MSEPNCYRSALGGIVHGGLCRVGGDAAGSRNGSGAERIEEHGAREGRAGAGWAGNPQGESDAHSQSEPNTPGV